MSVSLSETVITYAHSLLVDEVVRTTMGIELVGFAYLKNSNSIETRHKHIIHYPRYRSPPIQYLKFLTRALS